jgi:hypothetical protein
VNPRRDPLKIELPPIDTAGAVEVGRVVERAVVVIDGFTLLVPPPQNFAVNMFVVYLALRARGGDETARAILESTLPHYPPPLQVIRDLKGVQVWPMIAPAEPPQPADERTVKWDKEQTAHLNERLLRAKERDESAGDHTTPDSEEKR